MKTREQKLSDIRAACVAANPGIKGVCANHDYHHEDCFNCICLERSPRLANVLFALFSLTEPRERANPILDLIERYNLRLDDINSQSDECVDFIHGLIEKTV